MEGTERQYGEQVFKDDMEGRRDGQDVKGWYKKEGRGH
jgi:hypothetical protein